MVYNTGQLTFFVLMASLIMRLKLFAVPHLCVLSAVLFNNDVGAERRASCFQLLFALFGRKWAWRPAVALLAVALMAYNGSENVKKQLAIRGEYANEAQELLFHWIEQNTQPGRRTTGL